MKWLVNLNQLKMGHILMMTKIIALSCTYNGTKYILPKAYVAKYFINHKLIQLIINQTALNGPFHYFSLFNNIPVTCQGETSWSVWLSLG